MDTWLILTNEYMISIPQMAERFALSQRTLRRYRKAGVDVSDVFQVAAHIAFLQKPTLISIAAACCELSEIEKDLKRKGRIQ